MEDNLVVLQGRKVSPLETHLSEAVKKTTGNPNATGFMMLVLQKDGTFNTYRGGDIVPSSLYTALAAVQQELLKTIFTKS